MYHSFNIEIATKYGIAAATILNHLHFWIKKNEANGDNFHDGLYWTYCSREGFEKLFPYLSARQIDYAVKKLVDGGIVITGNFNKSTYDRTLWYAITKVGYCILQNCEMEDTNLSNGNDKIVKPIPDIEAEDIEAKDNITTSRAREDDDFSVEEESTPSKQSATNSDITAFTRFIEKWHINTGALDNYSAGKISGIDWDAVSEWVAKSSYLQQQKAVTFYIQHAKEILDGKFFDYEKPQKTKKPKSSEFPRDGNFWESDYAKQKREEYQNLMRRLHGDDGS